MTEMKTPEQPGGRATRIYDILLRLYPRAHRQTFGGQMRRTFQDHYHDVVEMGGESALRFWLESLVDVGRSLAQERLTALRTAIDERMGSMKTGGSVVLALVAALSLLLGLRLWLSPATLSAPHGGVAALVSVTGLALLLLIYALAAFVLLLARARVNAPERALALRRATLVGALLGVGALVATVVDTLGEFESPLSMAVWAIVIVAAPLGWGLVGLLARRAGGSWRLALVAALWSGMVGALVGAAGEVASTLLALPSLVRHELSNPDYLAWSQPDTQSYAIASALALGMIGLLLAPLVASVAGSVGSQLGKAAAAATQAN